MAMNILTEGKRFSTCTHRSSDVPLVVDLAVLQPIREKECLALQTTYCTRHDCVFLEVCRTANNTSLLVLKMLVVCIEVHV